MKFSFLPSLGALAGWSLSRHGQTSFQAPSHATSPGPGRIAFPAYVFSNQALIIGNGDPTGPSNIVSYFENPFETAIFSLDLTVPWSASAPAWHKIDRPAGFFDPYQGRSPSGQLVMNKDGSIVYFFQDMGVQPYYVHRGEWGPVANLTSEYGIHHSLMVDSDLGHIYGISSDAEDCFCGMCYLDNEWSLRMFDPIPSEADPKHGRGVYSNARKSFFFMSTQGATTFHEYNIADKTWSFVRASGDVPSRRMGVACYASVNNGKQILFVGGARSRILEPDEYDKYDMAPTPTEKWPYVRTTRPPSYEDWAPSAIPTTSTYPGYDGYRGRYYTHQPPPATTTYPEYNDYHGGYPTSHPSPDLPSAENFLPENEYPALPRSVDQNNQVLNEVFMFDVQTSVWTKVSTTPVGYYGSACAVSGDSLILFGGYKGYNTEGIYSENDNVPSIYDMKKNIWVSTYIPQ